MGQIVDLGYGKANLANTLATFASLKVEAPFARVSALTSGKRHGQNITASVGSHEIHGVLIQTRSEHENGTILLLQAAWKRGGASLREGAMFMRLRARGPTYRIQAKVPTGAENRYGDRFVIFVGQADIMNEADLAVAGLQVPRNYTQRYMAQDELEECFEITRVAAEIEPKPSLTAISTPEGLKLREIPQQPARRLRLRGG